MGLESEDMHPAGRPFVRGLGVVSAAAAVLFLLIFAGVFGPDDRGNPIALVAAVVAIAIAVPALRKVYGGRGR